MESNCLKNGKPAIEQIWQKKVFNSSKVAKRWDNQ